MAVIVVYVIISPDLRYHEFRLERCAPVMMKLSDVS